MLDSKDTKILVNIINNSRISSNSLSKKIGISREVIDYRIKKFEKEKIILNYQARLNLNYFSIMSYNLLLKLKNYNQKEEDNLIESLKKQKYTHYIAKIGGEYDFIIGFSIKKIEDLQNYLNNIYENFSNIISEHELFTQIEEIKDDFSSLIDNKYNSNLISKKNIQNKIEIDNIDKNIIKNLTHNAKISSVDLGLKLDMTSAGVAYRIKNLEKNNIILGYRTMINILKFNKQYYYVFFNLEKPTKLIQKNTEKKLISNPDIIFANKLAGKYNYLILICAGSNKEFYEKIKQLNFEIDSISKTNSFTILNFNYHNYIPEGFLDE